MDFSWNEEQMRLRADTAEFARTQLSDSMMHDVGNGDFDRSLWKRLGDSGVLGSCIPVEYGGRGLDVMTSLLMLEGLGYGCADNGLTLAANGQLWTVQIPVLRFGSEEQKKKYLPGLSSGELIGSHAITEAESGSDTYSLRMTAEPAKDGYLLNGVKTFIGMGPVCDVALVFASTNPDHGRWGISAFLVDADADGFTRGEAQTKMGLRTEPMGELLFEDCWVPESARLGPEAAGASISTDSLDWERSLIFASHVGSMERQLDETVEYARTRSQFGRPIGKFQSVSNRIANMRLRLDASKLLLYRAAWLVSRGESAQLESALAKLYFSESFIESSLDSVRIHGGVGYLSDRGVERDLRDSVGGVIYGGTSDIQRQVIAGLLGI